MTRHSFEHRRGRMLRWPAPVQRRDFYLTTLRMAEVSR